MIAADLVAQVRSLLLGSLTTEVNLLDGAYDPSDNRLHFKYSKRSLAPGTILSVGLNTFYVLEVGSSGVDAVVLPSYDGGPDVAAPDQSVVFIKPRLTTWAAFREIQSEARSLSSPINGLYWPKTLEGPVDWANGVYDLPTDFGAPIKLTRSRYKFSGESAWATLGDAEYQVERNAVRVNATPPGAIAVEFTFAMPFDLPTDLDSDLVPLGIDDTYADILAMGAAATLVSSFEGRRVQPSSQGDTRRAEEVSLGGSAALARAWRALQKQAIDQEHARLLGTYGYQMALPSGGERAPWSSASARVGSW